MRAETKAAAWVIQQLRESCPAAAPYRYVLLDRDSKYDAYVIKFLNATGLKPKRTSVQAPWQNGLAERWVGSCHREILDHIIALNEQSSPPVDPRLREPPSRRPHSRFSGERHAETVANRVEATCELNRDFNAAPGLSTPSVLLATGCVEPRCRPCALLDSPGRNHRRRASGCRLGCGNPTPMTLWPESLRAVAAGGYGNPARVHPLRLRGSNDIAARRYVMSVRTADSVLAADTSAETS
jgi:hypothetical protein